MKVITIRFFCKQVRTFTYDLHTVKNFVQVSMEIHRRTEQLKDCCWVEDVEPKILEQCLVGIHRSINSDTTHTEKWEKKALQKIGREIFRTLEKERGCAIRTQPS